MRHHVPCKFDSCHIVHLPRSAHDGTESCHLAPSADRAASRIPHGLQRVPCASITVPGCSIPFQVSPEVQAALARGDAVVALESTIVCHGMPYPQNLETAREVETIVREQGAVPATIAVVGGTPRIGVDDATMEYLARKGHGVKKVSRRDLAYVVSRKLDGATTVSATMLLASMAGIPLFVTGGIGGVHRDGESTMDVSADLTELGCTPVAVICAGAKTILDIPRTLEYLETQGVPVVGYGTDEFPAFFTKSSGCKAPCRLDTPTACAQLIDASRRLGLRGGMVFGVPIPEDHAAEGEMVERAIQQALREASDKGIRGAASTPFLLRRIAEITGGRSLMASILP
eukprot:jgi/Mesvir1/25488/Mv24026-RA.1